MSENRKLAAILAADVVGFSRLAGADEDRTLARLRALRSDLIDPTIAVHKGRVVKRTGDGVLIEFRSVVDAVRCAIEVQNAMVERNAGVPPERRIEFRIGIHLGDVVEESDGDLMGDGVNIAARLEGIAVPGAICLSEQAYWQVKGRLDLAVVDLGPTQLKNIAEPVRAYSLQVGVQAQAKPATPAALVAGLKKSSAQARRALALVVVAGIAIAAAAWHLLGANRETAKNGERSIVVLPLTNLSGDPGQDYLVDALTDELTTAISRLPGTFVIARNTAFTFKGKATDVKAIGKDLGVKYLLEGSAQPTEKRMRINAQLIEAVNGTHLWAESFDEDRGDLLQMEDDIVARLARTLDVALTDVEAANSARLRPANHDAQDLALRCQAAFYDNFGYAQEPVRHPEIYQSCEEALHLDPGNTRALALLAFRAILLLSGGVDITADLKRLDELVAKALALNPNDADARYARARVANLKRRWEEAIPDLERAIALNPSNVDALASLGTDYSAAGQPEKVIGVVDRAVRISPRDPQFHQLMYLKGVALSELGRDAEALEYLDRAQAFAPWYPPIVRAKIISLVSLGREAEARELFQRYAALPGAPFTTVKQYKAYLERVTANVPILIAFRERAIAAMRKAGMPEE
jgi:class 3 adenylate cyclase/TolB-like protein